MICYILLISVIPYISMGAQCPVPKYACSIPLYKLTMPLCLFLGHSLDMDTNNIPSSGPVGWRWQLTIEELTWGSGLYYWLFVGCLIRNIWSETGYDALWYGMWMQVPSCFQVLWKYPVGNFSGRWRREGLHPGQGKAGLVVYGIDWYWLVGSWAQKMGHAFYMFVQGKRIHFSYLISPCFYFSAL